MSPNDSFTWHNWNYAQSIWIGLCDLFLNKACSESHASHHTINFIGAVPFVHLWISHLHKSIWHIVKLQSHMQKSFALGLSSCNSVWFYFQYTSSIKTSWFDIPTYFKGTRAKSRIFEKQINHLLKCCFLQSWSTELCKDRSQEALFQNGGIS